MRLCRPVLSLVAVLLTNATIAHADSIVTFGVNGSYASSQFSAINGMLTGTLVIDVTNGTLESAAFCPMGDCNGYTTDFASSTAVAGELEIDSGLYKEEFNGSDLISSVALFLPVDSLVGYNGGAICSTSNPCMAESDFLSLHEGIPLVSGEVFPVGQPTVPPEPSSFVLLGTGVAGAIGLWRRRSRMGF